MFDSLCATRRGFLQAGIGGALATALPLLSRAQVDPLPGRGEILLRNGRVLTMDAALGDFERADVHLRDGLIVAVGPDLAASAADIVDASEMLVLPGFVETHWHLWTTFLRSMSGDRAEFGYFPTSRGIGAHYTANDMYVSARLALDQGRELFAVPGNVDSATSAGTNALVRDGCTPLLEANDVLGSLGIEPAAGVPAVEGAAGVEDRDAARVLAVLETEPADVDAIAEAAALDGARVLELLTALELAGLAERAPGATYARSTSRRTATNHAR